MLVIVLLSLQEPKLINEKMLKTEKISIATVDNVEQKTLMINKLQGTYVCANKFYVDAINVDCIQKRNHVYLIDKSLKNFKIRN
jgi:hypothetical protein